MSVATYDVRNELVSVTAAAAEHFRGSLAGTGHSGVRISVQESGCTGYKYVVEEVDAGADSDVKIELENGVRLFLDTGAVAILRGTEIDYAREGINYNLKFRNPNVVAECGCGESFNVE
jgi:iron-sulfur cluster assembly accessory protein